MSTQENSKSTPFNRTTSAGVKPWLEGIKGTQVLPIINYDDDVIRVEAGPGTGKTFGLVRRVQRILHPQGLNVPGKEVLVVAFNRVIAKQLRKEIHERLENSTYDGKPVINTIHALCLEIIGTEYRILLPHEREAMLHDILHEHPDWRAEWPRINNLEQALRDHEAHHTPSIKLWDAVDKWLRRHKAQLVSELPGLLLGGLQSGDYEGREYSHIIVDEFQDLTPGEQQLFLKLLKPNGKFMALGDPRQSIYTFRGNDREGLSKIDQMVAPKNKSVTDVKMTECQRCPAALVSAANDLMVSYPAAPMTPGSVIAANTHIVHWPSLKKEAEGMARAIVNNVKARPAEEHLAMVTRRDFGFALRKEIIKIDPNIKIDIGFSEGILETWAVREAFLFFCLLVDPDAPTWRSWLGYQQPPERKEGDKNKSTHLASERNADAYARFFAQCTDSITDEQITRLAGAQKQPEGSGGKNLQERAKRYVNLKAKFQLVGDDPIPFLNSLFDASSWKNTSDRDPETAKFDMGVLLTKACSMYYECKEDKPSLEVQEHLKTVARQLRYLIATKEPFAAESEYDLRITTLWGAKGITANHVYVIGLCNDALPGHRRDDYPGTEDAHFEEQRRLFYVSMTRSKETLVLSRATSITYGEAMQLKFAKEDEPPFNRRSLKATKFLTNIRPYVPESVLGSEWKGVG